LSQKDIFHYEYHVRITLQSRVSVFASKRTANDEVAAKYMKKIDIYK